MEMLTLTAVAIRVLLLVALLGEGGGRGDASKVLERMGQLLGGRTYQFQLEPLRWHAERSEQQ